MSGPVVLEAVNIVKELGEGAGRVLALKGVSLSLRAGELTLLMGPSGSGKTTLLSILGCILTPTSGSVRINGETGRVDVLPFQLVTMGQPIADFANELFAGNSYRDYLEVHGIGVQLTEALEVGSDVEETRNRELIAGKGSLPTWRELDLALRRSPKDMDRVRRILDGLSHSDVEKLGKEYEANTNPRRKLETDLLGTEMEQQMRMFLDRDEAATDLAEKRVLLQGGTFEAKVVTQELRLISPSSATLQYTAGLYYGDNDLSRRFSRGPLFSLANWYATSDSTVKAVYG